MSFTSIVSLMFLGALISLRLPEIPETLVQSSQSSHVICRGRFPGRGVSGGCGPYNLVVPQVCS